MMAAKENRESNSNEYSEHYFYREKHAEKFPSSGIIKYEPHHEKTVFLHMQKTKTQISFAVTAKLISVFVFATRIVQSLSYLNPKFQANSHLL